MFILSIENVFFLANIDVVADLSWEKNIILYWLILADKLKAYVKSVY